MGTSCGLLTKQLPLSPVARLVRREHLTAEQLTALRPARILVVRQHNQMGDMVCATPVLRAIAETWPEARVALVASPGNVAVVRNSPHLARVLVYRRPLRRLPAFLRELRGWEADLAIVLSSSSFSTTSAMIGLASGARYVVGADSRPFGWKFGWRCFSLQMPASPEVTTHAIEHELAPLRAVGVTTTDMSTLVELSFEDRCGAAKIAHDLGLGPGYWALQPGAGKRHNAWPVERFANLARRAAGEGRQVLVLHGPAERRNLGAFGPPPGSGPATGVVVAPSSSLGADAALLEGADRFLCNDTGIMHVAGALGVPTLALFGPTDPARWKPPAAEVVALRSVHRLDDPRGPAFGWMEGLDEDTVWRAWTALAGRASTSGKG